MYRRVVIASLLIGCVGPSEVEVGEVVAHVTTHQGTTYQDTTYQGTTYQGTTYQGTTYQGTTYQDAKYGNATVTGAVVSKTTLEVWQQFSDEWQQRLPDRICYWNLARTVMTECFTVNLNTTASPLAGTTFQAVFEHPETHVEIKGTLRIGSSTTDRFAVRKDDSYALHPLYGAGAGTVTTTPTVCEHPNGCAQNSDLWLLDIDLIDKRATVSFCPPGERAYALAGTWDENGTFSASSTRFTFACTSGTIAKCTRWGYRPFGAARKTPTSVLSPLADYHQSCIRAGIADYCASGKSFTTEGTLIDIYDYKPSAGQIGFVPTLKSFHPSATAFVWESTFDKYGATLVDNIRHIEAGTIQAECERKFYGDPPRAPLPGEPLRRRGNPQPVTPTVSVDTSTMCPHAESTTGRWLYSQCSVCTAFVAQQMPSCSQPIGGAWTASCVALASSCGPATMATHSECATGAPLEKHDTACTFAVCSKRESCCTDEWTGTCIAAANAECKGGVEGIGHSGTPVGFCGMSPSP
jgi:hypothetical protein